MTSAGNQSDFELKKTTQTLPMGGGYGVSFENILDQMILSSRGLSEPLITHELRQIPYSFKSLYSNVK